MAEERVRVDRIPICRCTKFEVISEMIQSCWTRSQLHGDDPKFLAFGSFSKPPALNLVMCSSKHPELGFYRPGFLLILFSSCRNLEVGSSYFGVWAFIVHMGLPPFIDLAPTVPSQIWFKENASYGVWNNLAIQGQSSPGDGGKGHHRQWSSGRPKLASPLAKYTNFTLKDHLLGYQSQVQLP